MSSSAGGSQGLPAVVEIVPPTGVIEAEVTVPGSKSITNRALVLAALAKGTTVLRGALWSDDTQVMVESLRRLGLEVGVEPDPNERANRTIRVVGRGGKIPPGGTPSAPLELFVGNAGTAARFLAALVCLGHGAYRIHGVRRMHERPQAELFQALRALGYQVESENDRLPAVVTTTGARGGRCEVSVRSSSQFASALLLAAPTGNWEVSVVGANADEQPYVDMTRRMVEVFPRGGGEFRVEPDASSGSYFWAAGSLLGGNGSRVTVAHWPRTGWQIDERFPAHLPPRGEISRARDLGDSIMTAMVMAPFGTEECRFTDLGRLRVQECERVMAMHAELSRCGARVEETGDTMIVHPSALHGAEIETYDDHRMAMCLGVVGVRVAGIRLRDPRCVAKTFPNFFAKLAAPPPVGLGVTILDAVTREALDGAGLLADAE